jgi:hypothetical protein
MQDFFGGYYFFFHEEAEQFLAGGEEIGDHGGGRMGTMGGTEGIVHIYIAELGKFFGKFFISFFFFLVKAEVFEQKYLSGLQSGGQVFGFLSDAIGREGDGDSVKELGKMGHNVAERIFIGWAILGPAQVAHQDDGASIGQDLLNGWNGSAHAVVVGDLEVAVQRNVEINPDKGFLTGEGMGGKVGHFFRLKNRNSRNGCSLSCGFRSRLGLF